MNSSPTRAVHGVTWTDVVTPRLPGGPLSRCILFCILLVSGDRAASAEAGFPPPIVVDASSFWARMPIKDRIADELSVNVPWLFNDTALILRERANVETTVTVSEAGTYYVYARARAGADGRDTFRVGLGTQVTADVTGDRTFAWKRIDACKLKPGPLQVRLTRINTAPVLDVLVLSQDPSFPEEALRPLQLHPEVQLLRDYRVPKPLSVNFGDADNDGRIDLFVMRDNYSASVIGHAGDVLWSYEAPTELEGAEARTTDDINGLIWDLDGDQVSEVLHWRYVDGHEVLAVADGRTGELKATTPWPMLPLPHAYNNNRIVIARFSRDHRAQHVIVYSDTGGQIVINAYDAGLELVWSHTEKKLKDHLGHPVYAVDLDGDGVDEIVLSTLVLDAQGTVVWDRFDLFDDHHDHFDQTRFADLNGDGRLEIVAAQSDVGVSAFDALTGRMLWWTQAEHTQRLQIGAFLSGVAGMQIAASARIYGNRQYEPYLWAQVHWLDPAGNLLRKWPESPLNCNPVFVKGDWRGDGSEHLFWHKFHMTGGGEGEFFFREEVYQMFDFMGDHAEEVITLRPDGVLRVYGFMKANHGNDTFRRDEEYLRTKVVNYDH